MTVVLDASMALSWLFEDERTMRADEALALVETDGAIVPSVWRLEVASALRNAVRRGRCDEMFVDRALSGLRGLTIHVDPETDTRAWAETLALCRQQDLTPYDAAYLEVAMWRGLRLASNDRDLIAAARSCGVDTLTA